MTQQDTEFGPDSAAAMLGLGPAQLDLLVQLAATETASGQTDLAFETLHVLIDLAPFFKKGRVALAELYRSVGDVATAEVHEEFSKGLEDA